MSSNRPKHQFNSERVSPQTLDALMLLELPDLAREHKPKRAEGFVQRGNLERMRPPGASFQMEAPFWDALTEICKAKGSNADDFITSVREKANSRDLASSTRQIIIQYFRKTAQVRMQSQSKLPCRQSGHEISDADEPYWNTLNSTLTVKHRILLVDDDSDVLLILGSGLSATHFEIVTAREGDEAIQMLTDQPAFSLIITDFAMVGMDGVDFLLEAKRLCPGIPGLVISGFAAAAAPKAATYGIACLEKPFRLKEINEKISALIQSPAHCSVQNLDI